MLGDSLYAMVVVKRLAVIFICVGLLSFVLGDEGVFIDENINEPSISPFVIIPGKNPPKSEQL